MSTSRNHVAAGILSTVAPSPDATPFDWMSPESREALNVGLVRLNKAIADAQVRVNLARWCTGREDCASSDHLACCLARTKRRRRTNR